VLNNPEIIKNRILYNKIVAKYLLSKGIAVLGLEKGNYSFVNTNNLKKVIKEAPFWIKIAIILKL